MTDVAYSAAKMAGRMAKATKAHATVTAACHRAQADASEISASAERRLADEVDAAHARGEVATGRDGPGTGIINGINKARMKEIGLTAKQVHDARAIRDAERDDPGIVKRTLDSLVADGKEPTKAALPKATRKKAVKEKHNRLQNAFFLQTDSAMSLAYYSGPIDEQIIKACNRTATKWNKLLTKIVSKSEADEDDDDSPEKQKEFFIFQANQIMDDARFDGAADRDICAAARRVVATWTKFLATLENRPVEWR
jgi:hypothetical protein